MNAEVGMRNGEFGMGSLEWGSRNAECGKKMKSEFGKKKRRQMTEKNYHGKTRKFTEELNPKNCLILSSGGTKRSERK